VRRFNGKAGIISSEKQRFKSLPIKLNFKLRNKDGTATYFREYLRIT
jgi:hypothetical protein